jgi:hypothetical protein
MMQWSLVLRPPQHPDVFDSFRTVIFLQPPRRTVFHQLSCSTYLVASQTPEIHKKTELKSIKVERKKRITAVEKKQRKQVLEFEANEIAKMAPASVSQTMPWQTSYVLADVAHSQESIKRIPP